LSWREAARIHPTTLAGFRRPCYGCAMLLQVCAAASLTIVLPKIVQDAKYTFDASSKISKQARAGAPCDAVIVADEEWALWLEAEAKKAPSFKLSPRKLIAENRLVYIQPTNAQGWPRNFADVAQSPPSKLALGGESVPVGRYAKKALETAGAWSAVEKRIVRADNDRMVLTWVARGDADAGIVYLSDVFAEPKVRTSFLIDEALHPKIQYFAFSLTPAGKSYVERLREAEAIRIFTVAGFGVAP
jgi:molybdate transport system substrate-binding protein